MYRRRMVWKKENSREKYDPQIRFVLSAGLGGQCVQVRAEAAAYHLSYFFHNILRELSMHIMATPVSAKMAAQMLANPMKPRDHYQQLYEQRYDDILNCYGASAAGDGDGSRDSLHG